jgi:hypothetical protein
MDTTVAEIRSDLILLSQDVPWQDQDQACCAVLMPIAEIVSQRHPYISIAMSTSRQRYLRNPISRILSRQIRKWMEGGIYGISHQKLRMLGGGAVSAVSTDFQGSGRCCNRSNWQ